MLSKFLSDLSNRDAPVYETKTPTCLSTLFSAVRHDKRKRPAGRREPSLWMVIYHLSMLHPDTVSFGNGFVER